MDEKSINLWRQIERCRRPAGMIAEDELPQALEDEDETGTPKETGSFMLLSGPPSGTSKPKSVR